MNLRRVILTQITLLSILSITSLHFAYSQTENQVDAGVPRPSFWSQLRYGGGIGLSFGSGFFSGTLAPSAIYPFNEKVAVGMGLNFTYNSFDNEYNSTIVGVSVISLFNPIRELQLSAEFEQLYVNRNYDEVFAIEDESYWYPGLFLGLGYGNRNVSVGIRFDVLYDSSRSIYNNPWVPFVRVYF